MTIGIPRALIFWKRPHFWEFFFERLDLDVLLSPQTNKEIIEGGVKISDPETCFSNKVYWGHLSFLDGKCDLIFVPRLKTDKEKLEYCPKFFGIPDLAKILVKTPILTVTFDGRKENFEKTILKLGKKINKNKNKIRTAEEYAALKEKEFAEKEKQNFSEKIKSENKKIILISHPYNLYDEYVNLRMKDKLEKLGTEVIFINEIPNFKYQIPNTDWPKFHWEFGREIMEKIERLFEISRLQHFNINGAIEISSFQCGCDAVLKEFVERRIKQNKIPFLYLLIDEHTGEAGFQTRLEAFIDTLK